MLCCAVLCCAVLFWLCWFALAGSWAASSATAATPNKNGKGWGRSHPHPCSLFGNCHRVCAATEGHLGILKAKLARYRNELIDAAGVKGPKVGGPSSLLPLLCHPRLFPPFSRSAFPILASRVCPRRPPCLLGDGAWAPRCVPPREQPPNPDVARWRGVAASGFWNAG